MMIAVNTLIDLISAIRNRKHRAFICLAVVSLVPGAIVMCNPFTLFRTFAVVSDPSPVYSGASSLINEFQNK